MDNYICSCDTCILPKKVDVPIELYKSLQGVYFIGYADNLSFGNNTIHSRVNLYVNVWTVTDISEAPYRAQFWFNATPPGTPTDSDLVTPTNTAIIPLPKPKIKLQYASNVEGDPSGGIKAFVRRAQPETTLVETENGKLIFPPGGSLLIFLSTPEAPTSSASGRIAFGWWEESVYEKCIV